MAILSKFRQMKVKNTVDISEHKTYEMQLININGE